MNADRGMPDREVAVRRLSALLQQRHECVAVAESCTGGGVAAALTAQPGSSGWFDRAWVTYSNAAKSEALGVSPELLERHGAVSREVVIAMAEGALRASPAAWTVAISGIAGPGGGTPDKPVGMVWFGLASTHQASLAVCHRFSGDRGAVQGAAVTFAIEFLAQQVAAKQALDNPQ